jgi:hypothetical protein
MRQTITKASAAKAVLLAVTSICVISLTASAQKAGQTNQPPPDSYLIRQDFSDCTNANVSANDPSKIGGSVWVQRMPDGTTSVKVAFTASPNTTYHFFLKCVHLLVDIRTGDEGIGEAQTSFRTNEAGNVFAFDMYPEGAPAGNKFQSVQVRPQ